MNYDAGVRFVCNAAAAIGSIFFATDHEGCSTKNDGLVAKEVCNERVENFVFVDGKPVTSANGEEFFCSGSFDIEEREAYLYGCLSANGCVDDLSMHAIG